MFVAKHDDFEHVSMGSEIQSQDSDRTGLKQKFRCPICGSPVVYNNSSIKQPFDYFTHQDRSPDCFEDESMSTDHRLTVEVVVKALHNRIREVTGEPVEIDVEKWIGTRSKFVVADVRITSPIRIAAEIYYKTERLGLRRRFDTMFSNGYRLYLIFHTGGKHNANEVERYIQRIAPLSVGRFDPETLELSLGDLFTGNQIEISSSNRELLPDYMVW
jgi:hypothetical protein